MKIHMYQSRHLFVEDDCVGKFDKATRTLCLFTAFAAFGQAIAQWMRNHHGVFPTIATGELAVANVAPLVEFPPEIVELMTPLLGDLTPAAVAYARENFSREDFKRRYDGRVDEVVVVDGDAAADPFEGEEFPQFCTDDEDRRVTVDRGEQDGVRGFVATCSEYPELKGFDTTPRAAVVDLGEAIEYFEATRPDSEKDGEGGESPPAIAAPVKKKRVRDRSKAAREAKAAAKGIVPSDQ